MALEFFKVSAAFCFFDKITIWEVDKFQKKYAPSISLNCILSLVFFLLFGHYFWFFLISPRSRLGIFLRLFMRLNNIKFYLYFRRNGCWTQRYCWFWIMCWIVWQRRKIWSWDCCWRSWGRMWLQSASRPNGISSEILWKRNS